MGWVNSLFNLNDLQLEWNSKIWTYSAALKAAAAQNDDTPATNASTDKNQAQTQNAETQTKAPEELGIGICCAD